MIRLYRLRSYFTSDCVWLRLLGFCWRGKKQTLHTNWLIQPINLHTHTQIHTAALTHVYKLTRALIPRAVYKNFRTLPLS